MSYTPVKIDDNLHSKMRDLAGPDRGAIQEEYRKAIEQHIARKTQEAMVRDTNLENYINERITRAENHLASMLGRTGMDTSMVLMGLLLFLEKYFSGKITREDLQEHLRKDAARYFSTAIQKDKADKISKE